MATYAAAGLTVAQVQAAIDLCIDGDTVTLPAGSGSWVASGGTPAITIDTAIHLKGAGEGLTNITVTGSGSWLECIILCDGMSTGLLEIDGITFDGVTGGFGLIYADDVRQVRFHDMTFDALAGRSIMMRERTYGLIDNCTWTGAHQQAIYVGNITLEDKWSQATPIATATGVMYIEDCDFSAATFTDGELDSTGGACWVFRHNIVHGVSGVQEIGCHGLDSIADQRSSRWHEVYDNSFTSEAGATRAIGLRGGSGVVHDNTFGDHWTLPLQLCCYRAYLAYSFGIANGSNPIDDPDQDENGWPARDQIGRGVDAHAWDNFLPDQAGPYYSQASEPFYQWNNVQNSANITCNILDNGTQNESISPTVVVDHFLIEGRDYHDNEQMPGYSELTYPHPLQGAASSDPWIMVYG